MASIWICLRSNDSIFRNTRQSDLGENDFHCSESRLNRISVMGRLTLNPDNNYSCWALFLFFYVCKPRRKIEPYESFVIEFPSKALSVIFATPKSEERRASEQSWWINKMSVIRFLESVKKKFMQVIFKHLINASINYVNFFMTSKVLLASVLLTEKSSHGQWFSSFFPFV